MQVISGIKWVHAGGFQVSQCSCAHGDIALMYLCQVCSAVEIETSGFSAKEYANLIDDQQVFNLQLHVMPHACINNETLIQNREMWYLTRACTQQLWHGEPRMDSQRCLHARCSWFVDQTIGGAVATGTHGSSFKYNSLSSQLMALDVVLANGTLTTFSEASYPHLWKALQVCPARSLAESQWQYAGPQNLNGLVTSRQQQALACCLYNTQHIQTLCLA